MSMEIRFEWDPKKSEANLRKHGLNFSDAVQVFYDPLIRVEIEGDEYGEIRWRAAGEIGRTLHIVSYTIREENEEEIYRIITARRATARERKIFAQTPQADY